MQSLRSTSVRQLCRSATASITRLPPNPLLSALFCRTRSFTSPSTRWYSSTSQFHHQTIEETREEKPIEVEEVTSAPTKIKSATSSLYIGNIPYSTTDDDLREIFSVYGPLRRVTVAKDYNDKPLGYAHLEFESQQDATKVNKDHKQSPMTIGDREIRMDYAFPWRQKGSPPPSRRAVKDRREPGRTVFLGNVPYEATREDIREVMEHLGDVAAVRISLNKEGNPRGFAHVDFTNTTEAEKVLKHYQHHPVQVLGRELRLDRSTSAETAYPPSSRLYFTKWEGNASSLRSHFRALRSKIVDVYIFKSSDPNLLTGSGFVEFRDLETATEALARFNTPELALAYARPSDDTKPRFATRRNETPGGFGLKPQKRHGRNDPDE